MRELKLMDDVNSCNVGISISKGGEQRQRFLALLIEIWEASLDHNIISCNAEITSCEDC